MQSRNGYGTKNKKTNTHSSRENMLEHYSMLRNSSSSLVANPIRYTAVLYVHILPKILNVVSLANTHRVQKTRARIY